MTTRLPDGFLWGGATADFQFEGGFGEGGRGLLSHDYETNGNQEIPRHHTLRMPDGTIVNGGVVLGQNTSEIKLKLEHDVLYFFKGSENVATKENALAYFASNKFWVNTILAEVFMIGTEEDNFIFKLAGSGQNKCLFISGKVNAGGSA